MGTPATVYDAIVGAYTIRQVTGARYEPNFQTVSDRFSGGQSPSQVSIITGDPVVSFETPDLASAVAALSATAGLAIVSPGTITIPFQDRAEAAAFEGSAAHQTLSATLGLIIPTEISASQDDEGGASLKLEFYPASTDGIAAPVAFNTGATLASQAFVGSYDLGPVKIASAFIGKIKSWRLMFGLKVSRQRYNGESYAQTTGMAIVSLDPMLEITFVDVASAQSSGLFGAVASTVTAFCRVRAAGSTHTADASSAHFSATLTGGLHCVDGISGSGQEDVSCVRRIIGKSLAFSAAAAVA